MADRDHGARSPRPRPRRPRRRKKAPLTGRAREERRLGWLLCAPAVVAMLLVTGYPIVYAIILSLQRYDLRFPDDREFVGLGNYITVLHVEHLVDGLLQHDRSSRSSRCRSSSCSAC